MRLADIRSGGQYEGLVVTLLFVVGPWLALWLIALL